MLKVMLPGFCALESAGVPPGKIHEYWLAAVVVLKETLPPAGTVTLEAGELIVPTGGGVTTFES